MKLTRNSSRAAVTRNPLRAVSIQIRAHQVTVKVRSSVPQKRSLR